MGKRKNKKMVQQQKSYNSLFFGIDENEGKSSGSSKSEEGCLSNIQDEGKPIGSGRKFAKVAPISYQAESEAVTAKQLKAQKNQHEPKILSDDNSFVKSGEDSYLPNLTEGN